MKKNVLILGLIALLSLSALTFTTSAKGYKNEYYQSYSGKMNKLKDKGEAKIVSTKTNLYSKASTSAKKLLTLEEGDELTVIISTQNFHKVKTNYNRVGYVLKKNVE